MNILVLGASGMLGHAVLTHLARGADHSVFGTVRSEAAARLLPSELRPRLLLGVDAGQPDSLLHAFGQAQPQVVINCIGLVKQLDASGDVLEAVPLNTLLPHRLARICAVAGARLVHISTDCVFSGKSGNYAEDAPPDAADVYGRSKLLGEVTQPNTITLRTSIIGPELASRNGLLAWFLAQQGSVRGFTRAVFSGLPTCELARVIADVVLPRPDLQGLYHVAAEPITKFDLLALIARQWGKDIRIDMDDALAIDRSLDGSRFRAATGYRAPAWPELVAAMHRGA